MIMLLFAVRDSAVEAYSNPLVAPTRAAAIRNFTSEVNDPQAGNVKAYPQNFDLYQIASYDTVTGIVTGLVTPEFIIKAIDVVKDSNSYPIGGV